MKIWISILNISKATLCVLPIFCMNQNVGQSSNLMHTRLMPSVIGACEGC